MYQRNEAQKGNRNSRGVNGSAKILSILVSRLDSEGNI
jgi:hypothetical protein